MHIYRVGGPRAPQSLANMQRSCFANDRELEKAKTELFPLPGGGPLGPEEAPKKKLGKSEGATKVATIQNPCVFTVSRGLIEEGKKTQKK